LQNEILSGKFLESLIITQDGLEESSEDLLELLKADEDEFGGRTTALNVSNIGMLTDFANPIAGTFLLERLHGASWSLSWGDCLYVLAASIRGKLFLSFVHFIHLIQ
jgi:hypothetical protein